MTLRTPPTPAPPVPSPSPPISPPRATPSLVAARRAALRRHRREPRAGGRGPVGPLRGARRAPGRTGQEALDRDLEVHRLTARLRALRRFGLDLCLGHMVCADGGEPVYIGRLGLTDTHGRRLLLDWRSPAAEPFFGATHANPMGLASRRRYRWTRGQVSDYWDEVFTPDGLEGHAALDDQSAFIASLGASRSPRMRDVLGTIAADQDAIIRAGSRGALVVDGGPGTGKTVVALHRTAYLLYSDPRLGHRRGGVLFVGPHQPYLAYVSDVLPSLGEEGVRTCTLRDLVPEGAAAAAEPDPEVARLKASRDLVRAVEPAVRLYEEPPTEGLTVDDAVGRGLAERRRLGRGVRRPAPGTPHNEARDDDLGGAGRRSSSTGTTTTRRHRRELVRRSLEQDRELRTRPCTARGRCWRRPTSSATSGRSPPTCVCAPRGSSLERSARCSGATRARGRCPTCRSWTRLGCGSAIRRRRGARRRRERPPPRNARETRRGRRPPHRDRRLRDARHVDAARPGPPGRPRRRGGPTGVDPDLLAGPVRPHRRRRGPGADRRRVADAAARCPSRSFTIVGDRAQARHGFTESWQERLRRVGLDRVTLGLLRINYRTPLEVMAEAEPVIRAVLPDANVPTCVRESGMPVVHGRRGGLRPVVDGLARHTGRGHRLRHRRPDGTRTPPGSGR